MSLICVKEGARKTFKIIESVLKTECFPVSARRGQNELNCIVNCTTYDRHGVERCFVSKSKTTYSVIVLMQGYSTTLSENESQAPNSSKIDSI